MTEEVCPRFYNLMKEISKNISNSRGLKDILDFFCCELGSALNLPLVWIGLKEDDGSVRSAARAGDAAIYLDTMTIRWDDSVFGNGTVGRAIKTGKPQLFDVRGEAVYFIPWLRILRELKINTSLALPIFNPQKEVIGALALYSLDIDAYSEEQIAILETYCTQISIVMELEKTKERLKYYELLFQYSRDIILFIASDGRILETNRIAEMTYGYTREEFKNLSIFDLCVDNKTTVLSEMAKAGQGGILFETLHKRKGGSILPVEVNSVCYEDDDDRVLISIVRDKTEQKKTEKKLRNKTDEMQRFFTISLDLLCIADFKGNFVRVNKAWENILGYPCAELENCSYLRFVHPEDLEMTLKTLEKLESGQEICNFVNRYFSFDGSYRYIEWRAFRWEKLIYAAARDITHRVQTEKALRESEERWQFALQGAGDGVWDWNIETGTVFFSSQWKQMLGYQEEEIPDFMSEWEERIHPEDKELCFQELLRHLKDEIPVFINEHRLSCKDGSYKWVLCRGKVMRRTAGGQPLRIIGTNADINERKKLPPG